MRINIYTSKSKIHMYKKYINDIIIYIIDLELLVIINNNKLYYFNIPNILLHTNKIDNYMYKKLIEYNNKNNNKNKNKNKKDKKNINGYNFEEHTSFIKTIITFSNKYNIQYDFFYNENLLFLNEKSFKLLCKKNDININKFPDEYIYNYKKHIFIEKKYQSTSGSVTEKIFLTDFYYNYYCSIFKNIVYILVVSDYLYKYILKNNTLKKSF